jgi:hypothetical protein
MNDIAKDEAPDVGIDNPDIIENVTEPKVKTRKPREPKIKVETLDATVEAPARKPRSKKVSPTVLANQLIGIHKILATVTKQPAFEIGDDEASTLAAALIGISEEYDVTISGKTSATIQLIAAFGMVYVPRGLYIIDQRKQKKLQAQTVESSNNSTESANNLNSQSGG